MKQMIKITPSEEYAIVQASLTNPSEFRVIYERYYADVFRFVFSKVNDSDQTADIVSNTFVKVITKLASYTYKGYSIKNWIVRIAYNETMEFFRKSAKRPTVSIEDEDLQHIADELEVDHSLTFYEISPFLDRLDDQELALIELRYFDKLKIREIAEIMDFTEAKTRVVIHRILKKLNKQIKEEVHHEQ